ncbi:MAG: hypothetical protein EXR17_06800 [Flavobacteriaceae bacterium]|nr:hypothetical protein [Flavobacteriaceae bacterium]
MLQSLKQAVKEIQLSYRLAPLGFRLGWIVVLAGLIFLRFWRLDERQWGYDELSAVLRAVSAKTWADHLHLGVATDGHPAGLQTLLWFWIRGFGEAVFPMRFITALVSLYTLWQLYSMALKRWGHESAYWVVTLMGLMWWQVSLGVWIRPYIFAMPFVLRAWDLVLETPITHPRNPKPYQYGWFSFHLGAAIAGAAYFHFFAGLTAGTAFVIYILQKKPHPEPQSKHIQGLHTSYMRFLPLSIAFLLYIPHLPLLFAQFDHGGLAWLAKPNAQFLSHYFLWVCGNNRLIALLLLASLVYAVIHSFQTSLLPRPRRISLLFRQAPIQGLLGFFIVFSVGFTYSVFRMPVLQDTALFFATPLWIFSAAQGLTLIRQNMRFRFLEFLIPLRTQAIEDAEPNGLKNGQFGTEIGKSFKPSQCWMRCGGAFLFHSSACALPLLLLFNTIQEKSWFNLDLKGNHHRIAEKVSLFQSKNTQNQRALSTGMYPVQIWISGPPDVYRYHFKHLNPVSLKAWEPSSGPKVSLSHALPHPGITPIEKKNQNMQKTIATQKNAKSMSLNPHKKLEMSKNMPVEIYPYWLMDNSPGFTLRNLKEKLSNLQPNSSLFLGLQSSAEPWLLPLIEAHFQNSPPRNNQHPSPAIFSNQAGATLTHTSQQEFLIGGEWLVFSNPIPLSQKTIPAKINFGGNSLYFRIDNSQVLISTCSSPRSRNNRPKPITPHSKSIGFTKNRIQLKRTRFDPQSVPSRLPEDLGASSIAAVARIPIQSEKDSEIRQCFSLSEFKPESNDIIILLVDSNCGGEIQTSLWNGDQQIDWRTTHIVDFASAGFPTAVHAIKLSDIAGWNHQTQLRCFVSHASRARIGLYKGNPFQYGIP